MADSVEMPRLIRNRAAAEEHGPYDPCITFIHACVQARYLSERVSSLMHTRGVCVCVCRGFFIFYSTPGHCQKTFNQSLLLLKTF